MLKILQCEAQFCDFLYFFCKFIAHIAQTFFTFLHQYILYFKGLQNWYFAFEKFEEKKCPWGSLQKINSVKMCKFFPPIVPPESVFRTFLYLSKLSRRCQLTPIQFLFQDFGLGLLCCLPSRCWCWSGSRQSWRGTSGRSRPGSAPPFLTHGWPK